MGVVEVPEHTRHELYGLPPETFTDKREERAAQAREQGDNDLASAIRRLRRPTIAAWAVNLLRTHESDRLAALLDIGDRLRSARSAGEGAEIRRGDQERSDLARTLAARAAELAAGWGRTLNPTMRHQVEETLNAAVSDTDIAELVRDGSLTRAQTYSGFGLDLASSSPAPPASGTGGRSRRQQSVRKPQEEQSRALREARDASDRTGHTLRQAEQALQQARNEQDRAVRRRDQAQNELDRREGELRDADSAVEATQRRRDRAAEEHSSARRRVEDVAQRHS